MGVIYEKLKRANIEYHPLLDEQHITFAGFIDMLMTFTDDTIEVIAKYLIDSNEFLQLDYYCAAYRNDKPTAILFKFDENGNDQPPSYPTKDYLQELIDGEIRINDADEYGWLVSDILNITAIKDIGLNDKAFTVLRYGESVNATSMIELENTRIRAAQLTFANERAYAQITDLESKLAQAYAALADAPANEQLNGHTEKSYQTTIGLLLELMTTPKGIDNKAPFQSQATIIGDILDKDIQGQRKTTLENRFRDANLMLADAKKRRPKPN